ncbi:MAG TPA: carbamoyltransferase C-terminal domain-containing protein [Nitrospira sp.]|nr:carbamoyltransferase C-terminal domain-containing protein [Nitrospira sp.]
MIILGINAFHADASACVVRDGQLIAAAEEERFTRVKHWAGCPIQAIEYCLLEAKVSLSDIDHIAVNRDPQAHLIDKALYTFLKRPNWSVVRDRLRNAGKVHDIKAAICEAKGIKTDVIKAQLHHVEHHQAHLGSAFFVSGYEEAAVASIDGFGDFVSTMVAHGKETKLTVLQSLLFPHSLGLFYLALTQYLGFPSYGDEYKVMGLAAYGEPEYLDAFRKIVRLKNKGRFELNLDYFLHHSAGVSMTWDGGTPAIDRVYSDELLALLGPARTKEEPVTQRHMNVAASLQAMYEEAAFHVLNDLYDRTQLRALCLAGGCALNSVANGKLSDRTPFERLYVPPIAGDAGGAIGAAYVVWHQTMGQRRSFVMNRADWGPEFSGQDIQAELDRQRERLTESQWQIRQCTGEEQLCRETAELIAAGHIVGWFQGRMELGARALGHRSILADPRRHDMKDILNQRIKRRESFRPFAPSVLEEEVWQYYDKAQPSPFMTMTYQVKPEKRAVIPAPTHVDGSGRVQTVNASTQPLYARLLRAFEQRTGVPILLNTSFNEQEPIVCTPREAIDCLLRTQMDALAIGNFVIRRST